jgi:MbtH protein
MAWDEDDTTIYHVVVNHEEQYSIWPDHFAGSEMGRAAAPQGGVHGGTPQYKEVPIGWRTVGKSGPKQECLDYIRDVWTDMRPLSLRRHMEEASLQEAASAGKEA